MTLKSHSGSWEGPCPRPTLFASMVRAGVGPPFPMCDGGATPPLSMPSLSRAHSTNRRHGMDEPRAGPGQGALFLKEGRPTADRDPPQASERLSPCALRHCQLCAWPPFGCPAPCLVRVTLLGAASSSHSLSLTVPLPASCHQGYRLGVEPWRQVQPSLQQASGTPAGGGVQACFVERARAPEEKGQPALGRLGGGEARS